MGRCMGIILFQVKYLNAYLQQPNMKPSEELYSSGLCSVKPA